MFSAIAIIVSIGLFGGPVTGYSAPVTEQPAAIVQQPAATIAATSDDPCICPPVEPSKSDPCICLPPSQGKDGKWYNQITGEEVPAPPNAE